MATKLVDHLNGVRALVATLVVAVVVTTLTGLANAPRADATPTGLTAAASTTTATPATACPFDYCPPADQIRLVSGYGSAPYQLDDAQFAALRELEDVAVAAVIARHGMTDTPQERIRMRMWNRTELRLELYAMLLAAAAKPVASRSAAERTALTWFGQVQQRQNLAVAEAAVAEYRKFYGRNAFVSGAYPENACTYVPPAPLQSEYPGSRPRWIGCSGRPGPIDLGPSIPSVEEFTKWGTAAVGQDNLSPQAMFLAGQASAFGIGLGSAAAAGGAAMAAWAVLPVAATNALMSSVFPMFMVTKTITYALPAILQTYAEGSVSTATATITASTGLSAGALVGVAAVVVVAIALIITAILQVVNDNAVGRRLKEAVDAARTTTVDPGPLLQTGNGMRSLLFALQSLTTTTVLDKVVDAPAPSRGGSTLLAISNFRSSSPPVRTDTFSYTYSAGDLIDLNSVRLSGGWWTDARTGSVTPRLPTQQLLVTLWDPAVELGATTDRFGFNYDAEVTTIMVDGRLKWLASVMDRPGYPRAGTRCADFHTDGCWITDTLNFYGDGTNKRQKATLVPNTTAAFDVGYSGFPVQHQPFSMDATRSGAAYTTDTDGDAVTVTWSVPSCVLPCRVTTDGTTMTVTPESPGLMAVRATATDSWGGTSVKDVFLNVADAPPTLRVPGPVSGTRSAPVEIAAESWDGPVQGPVRTTIDWGDGSPVEPVSAFVFSSNGRWSIAAVRAQHAYAARGTFTATVTASAGGLSRSATVPVTIGNAAPALSWAGTAPFQPASWTTVTPGVTLSATGQVTDADTDQPITVDATWYDGTVERIVLPPNGSTTRGFSLTHQALRSTRSPIAGQSPVRDLLKVTATDGSAAPVSLPAVRGEVLDADPQLSGVSAVGGRVDSATTISGVAIDPNGQSTYVGIRWNDGTDPVASLYGTDYPVGASGAFSASHTYTTAGTHTATVYVRDRDDPFGRVTTRTLTFVVGEELPIVQRVQMTELATAGGYAAVTVNLARDAVATLDWGDGTAPSTLTWPPYVLDFLWFIHTYERPGTYPLTLTVTEPGRDPEVVPITPMVVVNRAPVATRPAALTGAEGDPVTLPLAWTDNDARGVDGTVDVSWGDGTTSTDVWGVPTVPGVLQPARWAATPTHTYADPGTYPVQVTITDRDGAAVTTETTIEVGNLAPTLGSVTVTPGRAGSPSRLTVPVLDPGAGPGELTVDWGDGSGETLAYGPDGVAVADHPYADAGTWTATVTAADSAGVVTEPAEVDVVVGNAPPRVTAVSPGPVTEGSVATLAFTVVDAPADSGTATVDWGDGTSTTGLTWSPGSRTLTATHVYADDDPSGTPSDRKRISVVVTDAKGARGRAGVETAVRNVAPTLQVSVSDPGGGLVRHQQAVAAGTTLTLAGLVVDPGTWDTHTTTVDWGDGTSGAVPTADRAVSSQHTYLTPGFHRLTVRVRDDDGAAARAFGMTVRVVDGAALVAAASDKLSSVAALMKPGTGRTRLLDAVAAVEASPLPTGQALVTGPPADLTAALAAAADAVAAAESVSVSAPVRATALATPARQLALVARGLVRSTVAAVDPSSQAAADGLAALEAADRALLLGHDDEATRGYADAHAVLVGPPPVEDPQ